MSEKEQRSPSNAIAAVRFVEPRCCCLIPSDSRAPGIPFLGFPTSAWRSDGGTAMNTEPMPSLPRLRDEARRLHRDLRSTGTPALAAAERFRRLRTLSGKSPEEVLDRREQIRLKHALTVIALEWGFESWPALKASREASSVSKTRGRPEPGDELNRRAESSLDPRMMYDRGMDVLLNRWFARYEDAKRSAQTLGGFLLPFEHQFFVCEEEGIRLLGLDPGDPDWEAIGRNWIEPGDREAWSRLREKRAVILHRNRTSKDKPWRDGAKGS